MKAILLVVALVAVSQALSFDLYKEWNQFKLAHGKVYESIVEEKHRMQVFMKNALLVREHNQKFENGLASFKLTLNAFADLAHNEFIQMKGGLSKSHLNATRSNLVYMENPNVLVADSVDWRQKGAVTGVKDQAQCGSCWAFSAIGSLEGQHFLKTGQLVSLSEQNLVDCSSSYGNDGCNGGWMDSAFEYIKDNGGIDTEASYPYRGVDGKCQYNPANSGATVRGYVDVQAASESALIQAVTSQGPIAVAIDASFLFQLYGGGILDDSLCSSNPNYLNHGVLVVGYGTEGGRDYYIVKNSWGGSWGEQGYVRMSRNKNNQCGIANKASYPLV